MKYKVGDKVRVKSLEWYNKEKEVGGYIVCLYVLGKGFILFSEKMNIFCGRIVEIENVLDYSYRIKEDENKEHFFTDEMFEESIESIPDENLGINTDGKNLYKPKTEDLDGATILIKIVD